VTSARANFGAFTMAPLAPAPQVFFKHLVDGKTL
jgi:hypothetical protein